MGLRALEASKRSVRAGTPIHNDQHGEAGIDIHIETKDDGRRQSNWSCG